MVRVYRWDGKEMFINPSNVQYVEINDNYTVATMLSGPSLSLSLISYEILTESKPPSKGPGKAGFDVY